MRHSARATRNIGKLLGEAGKARARLAVILGQALDTGNVEIKNLDTGTQGEPVPLDDVLDRIRDELAASMQPAGRQEAP